MRLIFPNPKLQWRQVGDDWFLELPEDKNHVGLVTGTKKDGYYWYAYSYLEASSADIGWGHTKSIAEAKRKIKETLIAAGVAR